MERKGIKNIFGTILLYILIYALTFFYCCTIINLLIKFNLLEKSMALSIPIIIGGVIAAVICACIIWIIKDGRKTKFGNWIFQNSPKIILYCILSLFFFASIKMEIIWSIDDARDLVSLQWTIFAISMTIFLVWNVIILQYLKNKKPALDEGASLLQVIGHIEDKGTFYQDASRLFSTVTLLTINLIVLAFATGVVYIPDEKMMLVIQNIVSFSFLLCTNTIMQLFLDILRPMNEEKRKLLDGMKVTTKDMELSNRINEEVKEVLTCLERIDQLDNISGEEKYRIKSNLLHELISPPEQNAKKSEGENIVVNE